MAGLELCWIAGQQECLECGHEWVAVWPEGADALECPHCGSNDTAQMEDFAAEPHNKELSSWH